MGAPSETILVAMSGGVDSSVAAALLQERGHRVIGAFMRNGIASEGGSHRQGCCSVEDSLDARRVADRLQVPFYAVNLAEAFEGLIADFTRAYVEGRTPNPCIECNRRFKMGALLDLARQIGADAVATGHYARIVHREGRLAVARGVDAAKDQSYVLYPLEQEALARTRLPLGELGKGEVREEARRRRLPVADKPESMEICFVPGGDYRELLRQRAAAALLPGPIVNRSGEVLGHHQGTALFTIGQRRGLPGGQREPIYVTAIDPDSGTVTVGGPAELAGAGLVMEDVVWSGLAPAAPGTVIEGEVKIRAHHRPVGATARVREDRRVTLSFAEPQAAVTPGQAAVLYGEDRILLGGTIAGERFEV
jgi:tRNA-specific 2-thiouridylase